MAEREEISRGVGAAESYRTIATRLGRANDCAGGTCEQTVKVCPSTSGDRAGAACVSEAQCGGFVCDVTGRYCWGGSQ